MLRRDGTEQKYNGGRKPLYEEKHRTRLFNASWKFMAEKFDNSQNEGERMEIVKMIMPALAKTVPQVNINDNLNETKVKLGEDEQKIIQELSQIFIEKIKNIKPIKDVELDVESESNN